VIGLLLAGNTNFKRGQANADQTHAEARSSSRTTTEIPEKSIWPNLNQNEQTIYQWNRHSMYITNMASIRPNSNHASQIERNKFHIQRFKSKYLIQFSMKIKTTSCNVLYKLRSTQAISWFWELLRSSSNLVVMAAVESTRFHVQELKTDEARCLGRWLQQVV
jgi:hypothetical protein